MCGFCGFINTHKVAGSFDHVSHTLTHMLDTIIHRGPDDEGKWFDHATDIAHIALGHRRLSIQDLSAAGHQPMSSATERFIIVFNGEIYNFEAIRQDIEAEHAYRWHGHSDTEVILAAIECWGVAAALKRMTGMFAFALWDKQAQTLYLARDRMGEKPLYFGWQQGVFLFGSELKALRAHPAWNGEIDRNVLASYLRYGYIAAPHSIYSGIYKLQPGHYLAIATDDLVSGINPEPTVYWSIDAAEKQGALEPFTGSAKEASQTLDGLLRKAISGQMIADVPVGAFLSGGIDSSTIVAFMQDISSQPVNTFTIGFEEKGYNEAEHAKAVANHLGTHHTELYVTPQQALDVIPKLPSLYDEPFADASQIPTFLVSELARQQVTVSLSGDGGDELFCGYSRYDLVTGWQQRINKLPYPVRKLFKQTVNTLPAVVFNKLLFWAEDYLTASESSGSISQRLKIIAEVLNGEDIYALYRFACSGWKNPNALVIGAEEVATPFDFTDDFSNRFANDPRSGMMFIDQQAYLPDDILAKVDRAGMGVSLESRIPLLDHHIVEFAWSLPNSIKMHKGEAKWPLRDLLYQHVPQKLVDRPKMGFGVPIDHWLRGPVKEWAEALLDEQRLREEGYFNPALIQQMWYEHCTNKADWHYTLWYILIFQQWLESQSQ